MRAKAISVALFAAAAASACSPEALPDVSFTRTCDGRYLAPCDIRESSCRAVWFDYTACLRDVPTPAEPPTQIIDAQTLADRFAARMVSDERRTTYEALSLLNLMPADMPVEMAEETRNEAVAAFYAFDDQTIYIVDRGQPLDSRTAVGVYVHESVHAMQDNEHGLKAFLQTHGTTYDRQLAALSVVEGEASFYQVLADLALDNLNVWVDYRDTGFAAQDAIIVKSAAPFTDTPLTFPYQIGRSYVMQAWLHGTDEAVAELFTNPPVASEQLARPFEIDPSRSNLETWSPLTTTASVAPAGWRALDDGAQLGRWLVHSLVLRQGGTVASFSVPTWRGDTFRVFVDDDDNVGFTWHIRFRTEDPSATETVLANIVGAGLAGATPALTRVRGRHSPTEVVLVGVETGDLEPWLEVADVILAR